MGKFENNILGFVPKEDLLEIGYNVTRQNDPIDGLFSDEKTNNLVAKWFNIASEYQIPMMAQFHAWDTESRKTFRIPIDQKNIEKGLIKVKLDQSERMRELMGRGVVEETELYEAVMNDAARLSEEVFTRSKVAKNEVLATGKMTIKENNLDLTIDYGVPAANMAYTIDLAGDIPTELDKIASDAKKKGVPISGMVTTSSVLAKFRRNGYFQQIIGGSSMNGKLVRMSELEAYLQEEFKINQIITNDLTYGASFSVGDDGRPDIVQKNYYPEDKITFFSSNPAGRIGVGLWGDPPAASNFETKKVASSRPYVIVDQYMETDPDILWTRAGALFIPVLYNPNSLFISAVTDSGV
ncbi:MAG: major capsid protein [Lachnospiraceae bacterium]|nr:major capsid protein [Lachnospiraceae bacterium]